MDGMKVSHIESSVVHWSEVRTSPDGGGSDATGKAAIICSGVASDMFEEGAEPRLRARGSFFWNIKKYNWTN